MFSCRTGEDSLLRSSLRSPVSLPIGDNNSGCKVIDLNFHGATVHIGEISFVNNYTAYITVKFRKRSLSGFPDQPRQGPVWQTLVPKTRLMPDPHCENGGQDFRVFSPSQMLCDPEDVTGLRFICKQPSPHWRVFGIDDLRCYARNPPPPVPKKSVVDDMTDLSEDVAPNMNLPNTSNVAVYLQNLHSLNQIVSALTPQSLGRFDTNNNYEINLLAYN